MFNRFWPKCPYPIYLISNFKNAPANFLVETIKVGDDKKWSSNMIKALNKIDQKYIIYLQDDYFLDRKVNINLLKVGLNKLVKLDAACLRLMPSPRPDIPLDKLFGQISKNAPFRVCLQATVWNKSILKSLMVEGEDGWGMEKKGTIRSKKINQLFLSYKGGDNKKQNIPLSYFFIEPQENCFFTAVNQGIWLYEAILFLYKHGLKIFPIFRKVCTAEELFKYPERFYQKDKKLSLKYLFTYQFFKYQFKIIKYKIKKHLY